MPRLHPVLEGRLHSTGKNRTTLPPPNWQCWARYTAAYSLPFLLAVALQPLFLQSACTCRITPSQLKKMAFVLINFCTSCVCPVLSFSKISLQGLYGLKGFNSFSILVLSAKLLTVHLITMSRLLIKTLKRIGHKWSLGSATSDRLLAWYNPIYYNPLSLTHKLIVHLLYYIPIYSVYIYTCITMYWAFPPE